MTLRRRRLTMLLLALFALTASARAQSAGWRVTTVDAVFDDVTLVDVTDDSLHYTQHERSGIVERGVVAVEDLVEVRRARPNGALIGSSFGVALGLVGYAAGDASHANRHVWFTEGEQFLIMGGLVAGAGAIIGAIVDPGDAVLSLESLGAPQRRAALARIVMFDRL